MKPRTQDLKSSRLLDQLRERIRYLHYSLRTEEAYVYWVRDYIRWNGLRHPRDMGAPEVESYLTGLATQRRVSASTHNQALSGILFLYREVLGIDLPWLSEIGRPTTPKRIPSVLTVAEVSALLQAMEGDPALAARLMYGAGLRLLECLRFRIKDVDLPRRILIVRQAKGSKDRVTMLPHALVSSLKQRILESRALWEQDRLAGLPGLDMPYALDRKYPRAGQSFAWFWVFPSPTLSTDPLTGVLRRHHLFDQRFTRALKAAARKSGLERPVSAHTLRHYLPFLTMSCGVATTPCFLTNW